MSPLSRLQRLRARRTGRVALASVALAAIASIVGLLGGFSSFAAGEPASVIVRFDAGTTTEQRDAAIAAVGGTVVDDIPVLRMEVVEVTADDVYAALATLRADDVVTSADLDRPREAQAAPNDPNYDVQWALDRIGWGEIYGTLDLQGTSRLAVLDTGVDGNDPDLAERIIPGWSAFPDSTAFFDPNGHGTALASIAASVTDNGEGIAGVAYGGVEIMPVQVLDGTGVGQDADIIEGLVWAVDQGADVALMGFSSTGYSSALQAAVEYAWSNGVVVVAAAGNDGSSASHFPAAMAKVVGVAATDQSDERWYGSNYGSSVFMAAPGTGIESILGPVTGTSPAAAIVAGAAALLEAVDPGADPGVIVGRLARNADPVGSTDDVGNGILDLAAAVTDGSTERVVPVGGAPAADGGPYVSYRAAACTWTISKSLFTVDTVGAVTVQNTGNNCTPAASYTMSAVVAGVASTTGQFSLSSTGTFTSTLTLSSLLTNSTPTTIYYRDSSSGSPTFQLKRGTTLESSAVQLVGAKFGFTGFTAESPPLLPANGTGYATVTVQLQDAAGVAVSAVSGGPTFPIYLCSTSGTGIFTTTTNATAVASVTVPTGSSSVQFRYYDSTGGTPTIRADDIAITNCQSPPAETGIAKATQVAKVLPIVTISNAPTVTEGTAGAKLSFPLNIAGWNGSTGAIGATLAFSGMTGGTECGGGVDYITPTFSIPVSSPSPPVSFDITVCDDATPELDETLSVTFSAPTNAYLAALATSVSATGRINDDDLTVSIAPTAATSVAEGTAPAAGATVSYTVELSAAVTWAVSISYTVSNTSAEPGTTCQGGQAKDTVLTVGGTAAANATSGTIAIPAGSRSVAVVVTTCPDTIGETDETMTLTFNAPTPNGRHDPSPATRTFTILDDDNRIEVRAINDLNGNGAVDTGEAVLPATTITLCGPSATQVPKDDAGCRVQQTPATGYLPFAGLGRGVYWVWETNPTDFRSTNAIPASSRISDDLIRVDLTGTNAASSVGNTFLDSTATFEISGGFRFDADASGDEGPADNDSNGDAIALEGTVTIYKDALTGPGVGVFNIGEDTSPVWLETPTLTGMQFTFRTLQPGTYFLVGSSGALAPTGVADDGDPVTGVTWTAIDRSTMRINISSTAAPGSTISGKRFLLAVANGSISGSVIDDVNADGLVTMMGSGGPTETSSPFGTSLPTIQLRTSDGSVYRTAPDSVNGTSFSFTGLPVGTYDVVEVDPTPAGSYFSTSPNTYRVVIADPNPNLAPGTTTLSSSLSATPSSVLFLDTRSDGQIVATVVNDLDGSGTINGTEGSPLLTINKIDLFHRVTSQVDGQDVHTWEPFTRTDVTVKSSTATQVTFGSLPPGIYCVAQTDGTSGGNSYASTNSIVTSVGNVNASGEANAACGPTLPSTGYDRFNRVRVDIGRSDANATLGTVTTRFLDVLANSTISGGVYEDLSPYNGVLDLGEPGIGGAVVRIYRETGAAAGRDAADVLVDEIPSSAVAPVGVFTKKVPIGTYYVVQVTPQYYTRTGTAAGTTSTATTSVVVASGEIQIDLKSQAATTNQNNHFLLRSDYAISGYVVDDRDGSATFNVGDGGVSNSTVTLYAATLDSATGRWIADGAPLGSKQITDSGFFGFSGQGYGNYLLIEENPVGAAKWKDLPGTGGRGTTALGAYPNEMRVCLGALSATCAPSSSGNFFFDTRNDFTLSGWAVVDGNEDFQSTMADSGSGALVSLYRDSDGDLKFTAADAKVGSVTTNDAASGGGFDFGIGTTACTPEVPADGCEIYGGTYFVVSGAVSGKAVAWANASDLGGGITAFVDPEHFDVVRWKITPTAAVATSAPTIGGRSFSFLYRPNGATLSGAVVLDVNGNGLKDAGEGGLPVAPLVPVDVTATVTVTKLDGPSEQIVRRTTTSSTFSWSDLPSGTYRITEIDPTSYGSTAAIVDPATDNKVLSQGQVEVLLGATPTAVTFLDAPKNGSIAGSVYNDTDGNGAITNVKTLTNDSGLNVKGGVKVKLFRGGTESASTYTSTAGAFTFANLLPGTYSLTYEPIVGWLDTTPGVDLPSETGYRPYVGSVPQAATLAIALAADAMTASSRDFFTIRADIVISGTIWHDLNANGRADSGKDVGLPVGTQVKVTRRGVAGALPAREWTLQVQAGDLGKYATSSWSGGRYDGFVAGDYDVTYVLPDGWVDTATTGAFPFPASGLTLPKVSSGKMATGNDFFAQPGTTFTGGVYNDANGDGAVAPTLDSLIDAAQLDLYAGSVNSIPIASSTMTGARSLSTKSFSISGLKTGTYYLIETNPSTYSSSGVLTGSSDTSVTRTAYGSTSDGIQIIVGDSTGAVRPITGIAFLDTRDDGVTISGVVYDDVDASGRIPASGATLAGAVVEVWKEMTGAGFSQTDDLRMYASVNAGARAATATTAASGAFSFGKLPTGTYYVREVSVPTTADKSGLNYDKTAALKDATKSLTSTSTVTVDAAVKDVVTVVAEGAVPSTAQVAFTATKNNNVMIRGLVCEDENGTMQFAPTPDACVWIPNVTIELIRDTTTAAGRDADGIGASDVPMWSLQSGTRVSSVPSSVRPGTVNFASSGYVFGNLPQGLYYLRVSELPAKTIWTGAGAGYEAGNYSACGVTCPTPTPQASPFKVITVDARATAPGRWFFNNQFLVAESGGASITGYAYDDTNADGLRLTGATGGALSGVTIELRKLDAGGTVGAAAAGTTTATCIQKVGSTSVTTSRCSTTTTDANGKFSFADLPTGDYVVRISGDIPGPRTSTASACSRDTDCGPSVRAGAVTETVGGTTMYFGRASADRSRIDVRVTSEMPYEDNWFLMTRDDDITIGGYVYDDVNGDTVGPSAIPPDPTKAGAVIEIWREVSGTGFNGAPQDQLLYAEDRRSGTSSPFERKESQTTTADGTFAFGGLPKGTVYYLVLRANTPTNFVPVISKGATSITNFTTSTSMSTPSVIQIDVRSSAASGTNFSVPGGSTDPTISNRFLVTRGGSATLGGWVVSDTNGNGADDSWTSPGGTPVTDTGLGGATLRLYRKEADGSFTEFSTTTNLTAAGVRSSVVTPTPSSGFFQFKGLLAGATYRLDTTLPTNYVAWDGSGWTASTTTSQLITVADCAGTATPRTGTNCVTVLGALKTGTLSGRLVEDVNSNDVFDPASKSSKQARGDFAFEDAKVSVYRVTGTTETLVGMYATTAGAWATPSATKLLPGLYRVIQYTETLKSGQRGQLLIGEGGEEHEYKPTGAKYPSSGSDSCGVWCTYDPNATTSTRSILVALSPSGKMSQPLLDLFMQTGEAVVSMTGPGDRLAGTPSVAGEAGVYTLTLTAKNAPIEAGAKVHVMAGYDLSTTPPTPQLFPATILMAAGAGSGPLCKVPPGGGEIVCTSPARLLKDASQTFTVQIHLPSGYVPKARTNQAFDVVAWVEYDANSFYETSLTQLGGTHPNPYGQETITRASALKIAFGTASPLEAIAGTTTSQYEVQVTNEGPSDSFDVPVSTGLSKEGTYHANGRYCVVTTLPLIDCDAEGQFTAFGTASAAVSSATTGGVLTFATLPGETGVWNGQYDSAPVTRILVRFDVAADVLPKSTWNVTASLTPNSGELPLMPAGAAALDNTTSAPLKIDVVSHATMSLSTISTSPIAAGTTQTFWVTMHNAGPSYAWNLTLTEAAGAIAPSLALGDLRYCFYTGTGPGSEPCTDDSAPHFTKWGASAKTLSFASMQNLTSRIIVIKGDIPASADPQKATNTVTVTSTDSVLSGNVSDVEDYDIILLADLGITGSVNAPLELAQHFVGEPFSYTLTVTNNGWSDARQVDIVTDAAGITGASITTAAAYTSCTVAGKLCIRLTRVNKGVPITVTVSGTAEPSGGSTFDGDTWKFSNAVDVSSLLSAEPEWATLANTATISANVKKRPVLLTFLAPSDPGVGRADAEWSEASAPTYLTFQVGASDITRPANPATMPATSIEVTIVCTSDGKTGTDSATATTVDGVATVSVPTAKLVASDYNPDAPGAERNCTATAEVVSLRFAKSSTAFGRKLWLAKKEVTVTYSGSLFVPLYEPQPNSKIITASTKQVYPEAVLNTGVTPDYGIQFDWMTESFSQIGGSATITSSPWDSCAADVFSEETFGIKAKCQADPVVVTAQTYMVRAYINPSDTHYRGQDIVYVTVYEPTADRNASGAGWMAAPTPNPLNRVVVGGSGRIFTSFSVRYRTGATTPSGTFNLFFFGKEKNATSSKVYRYVLKSTTWKSGALGFTGTYAASFGGTGVVQKIDPITGLGVSAMANVEFRIDVVSPGRFAVSMYTRDCQGCPLKVWFQAGTPSNFLTLGGGSIVVKSK